MLLCEFARSSIMRVLSSGVVLAACFATGVTDVGATAVTPFTAGIVNCGAGGSISYGPPISCSVGESSAAAYATYTSLKAEAHNAPTALAAVRDSARFLPGDAALLGAAGTARITLNFDGSLGIGPDNFLEIRGYEVDPITGLKAIRYEAAFTAYTPSGIVRPFSVSGAPAVIHFTSSPEVATIIGSMTFIYDYTFGSDLNYEFQMAAVAPTGDVDFYNTATISQAQVFDAFGNAVAGAFTTASGTILPTATPGVPEPATWAMMIVGFSAIGFSIRRKQRQSVRYSFG
jgi:hypothetical protein